MRSSLFALPLALAAFAATAAEPPPPNDYPTAARVDYVIGCMATNGQDQLVMQKCSCSIDVIASLIPYADYVEASTAMSLQGETSERFGAIRDTPWVKDLLDRLRQAQVEADLQCF
jgi:hypothetical protein